MAKPIYVLCVICGLWCLLGGSETYQVSAQSNQHLSSTLIAQPSSKLRLETVLDSRGRILPHAKGSFDPKGYTLTYDPLTQAPRFSPSTIDAGYWDERFGFGGINGEVRAIAVHGKEVYVGGSFTGAGGNSKANYIARWDGASWQALGAGLNNQVNAITIHRGVVYVGGSFSNAGENPNANGIARWDGTSWQALGAGLNHTVTSLAAKDGEVYVGGYFTDAGENPNADGIARWNGTSWHSLGTGISNGSIRAMAVYGTTLYIGGDFKDAGGNLEADGLAQWDGTTWRSLGAGLSGSVYALAVQEDNLYVGGYFLDLGGNPNIDCIARWDGTKWHSLKSGLTNTVLSLAVYGKEVYVGGAFLDADKNPNQASVLGWDGNEWQSLNIGGSGGVYAIAASEQALYLGGTLKGIGAEGKIDYITHWDGHDFQPLANSNSIFQGLNFFVSAVAVNGEDVYVGGAFINAGGNEQADHIARWDGQAWQALGPGLNDLVTSLAISENKVYAGGYFTDAGGNPDADGIAYWDGQAWQAMGQGLHHGGSIQAIAARGKDVYAGGWFGAMDGVPNTKFIAYWNGNTWQSLGTGLNNWVFAIAIGDQGVYVGGDFTNAGSNPHASYLARWDDHGWHALGTGVNQGVRSLAIDGVNLYAGGNFTHAGGNPSASRFAQWNGSAWQALGTTNWINSGVNAIAVNGSQVYIGGAFSDHNHLAYWDGHTWQTLGGGLNDTVHTLASHQGQVYVGGTFTGLGNTQASHFGIFTETFGSPTFSKTLPIQLAALEDQRLSYTFEVIDLENDLVTIRAINKPLWLTVSDSTSALGKASLTLIGMPEQAHIGTHTFTLEASDGIHLTKAAYALTIASVNDAPRIVNLKLRPATQGQTYQATLEATDEEGQAIYFSIAAGVLPLGLHLATDGKLSGTPNEIGTFNFSIRVTDSEGASNTYPFSMIVLTPNSKPYFTSSPSLTATEDTPYTYLIRTKDPEGDLLALTATKLPEWLKLMTGPNGEATLSGTPLQTHVGLHQVVLEVNDGISKTDQAFNLTVVNVNDPPVWGTSSLTTAVEDQTYTHALPVLDEDQDPLTCIGRGLPNGLVIDACTLKGIPLIPGRYPITLQVNDGNGGQAEKNYTLEVINTNDTPTESHISTPRPSEIVWIGGQSSPLAPHHALIWTWSKAHDPDGDAITYRLEVATNANMQDILFESPSTADTSLTVTIEQLNTLLRNRFNTPAAVWDQVQTYFRITTSDPFKAITQGQTSAIVFRHGQIVSETTESGLPRTFQITEQYPNPFRNKTTLRFDIPVTASLQIYVYDSTGRLLDTWQQIQEAGFGRTLEIDAHTYPTGLYLYRVVVGTPASGTYFQSGKMLVIK